MADDDNSPIEGVPDDDDEISSYKPPPEKSLNEMLEQDKDDEALRKYKETLLGSASKGAVIVDHSNCNRVLVRKLALVVDGHSDKEIDLSDVTAIKDSNFIIKEGICYKIRIDFHVQREIVTGLKYVQKTYRKGICVDKMTQMVGSYAPKEEVQSFITPGEDAPSGLVARGHYTVKSLFTDDDGNEHLKWDWSFDIKKDWE